MTPPLHQAAFELVTMLNKNIAMSAKAICSFYSELIRRLRLALSTAARIDRELGDELSGVTQMRKVPIGGPSDIRTARATARDLMHGWSDADQVKDAELLAQELAKKAARQGGGSAVMRMEVAGEEGNRRFRVRVIRTRSDEVPKEAALGDQIFAGIPNERGRAPLEGATGERAFFEIQEGRAANPKPYDNNPFEPVDPMHHFPKSYFEKHPGDFRDGKAIKIGPAEPSDTEDLARIMQDRARTVLDLTRTQCLATAEAYQHLNCQENVLKFIHESLGPRKVIDWFTWIANREPIIVARSSSGDVIGMVKYYIQKDSMAYIDAVYVRPGWNGGGIGQQLMHAAFDEFREKGCIGVRLHSTERSAAHEWYMKHFGFTEGTLDPVPGPLENAHIMARQRELLKYLVKLQP
ncbi:GNAT family N-acetyltransferase [Nocardia panacis]|uniref:GNAT family N-acetyltransferase n=1 Tax=Nocardia panacis TaxID=2340916 RepID=A0A3A4KWP9_9NOCA|nr:GNAT family N-acetyltransferase [Nocardia panacis]RJO79861.1 GNAT family N-acetyltransferase [Nocardia panacis]